MSQTNCPGLQSPFSAAPLTSAIGNALCRLFLGHCFDVVYNVTWLPINWGVCFLAPSSSAYLVLRSFTRARNFPVLDIMLSRNFLNLSFVYQGHMVERNINAEGNHHGQCSVYTSCEFYDPTCPNLLSALGPSAAAFSFSASWRVLLASKLLNLSPSSNLGSSVASRQRRGKLKLKQFSQLRSYKDSFFRVTMLTSSMNV